ncbi:MAG: glycerol kinase GlpK [Desulfovermiculus sp.]|nr:glycerol kinase GlpK [Desulfovermiculus sp.]
MANIIMALDQGTTSSRTILYNEKGETLAMASEEFSCQYPEAGWVEQNAEDIWRTQKNTMDAALKKAKLTLSDVDAIGISNQRETVTAWNADTGQPVGKSIVWQCRRTADYCDQLKAEGFDQVIKEKTGLVTDAYFSGSKIRWLLRNNIVARELASQGRLKVGTVDSWLIWNLTGGKVHATDVSNACRTMIFNIHELKWEPVLLEKLGIPEDILPEVKPSSGILGKTDKEIFGCEVPIAGVAGDQQAALFGQACYEKGMTKITYGTGCFMVMNTGDEPIPSPSGLLTTIAWQIGDKITYALEGSVFIAGALMQWMRDDLNLFSDVSETEKMATSIKSSEGLYIVPAFVGLGAPHWDPYARGIMVGITRGTTKNHIVRAGLQSLAFQANDLLTAMVKDSGIKIKIVKVDGGASANNYLCQFQADILGVRVSRPEKIETTAMGAAFLAGLGVGVWKDMDQIKAYWTEERSFQLNQSQEKVESCLRGWQRAVERAKGWAKD